jgi:hypothetical protein
MKYSPQLISLPTHENKISFSRKMLKRNYQNCKEILWFVYHIMFVRTGQCIRKMCQFCWLIWLLKNITLLGFFGEKSKPLLCRVENGVIFTTSRTIVWRTTHDSSYWSCWSRSWSMSVQLLNFSEHEHVGRYLTFILLMYITASNSITCNLPSNRLLMGLCLSAFRFYLELFNRLLSKSNWRKYWVVRDILL